jgi:glycosyltransferase involved in cell wall biosynthesis
MSNVAQPLVSILIRSMDRPTLERALRSAALQTWPNLEIVVVAACGRSHRPLPAEFQGRPLRLIFADGDRRLSRPQAANVALEAAHGEWLNFLDDDDELLPQHLSALLASPRSQNERVIYARTRVLDANGTIVGHCNLPGYHVQFFYQNRTTTCATLLHRSLIDEGARFDADFAVYEDHDFYINCAARTPFLYVAAATSVWHAFAGESGCGHGVNDNVVQRHDYRVRLRLKWKAQFDIWWGDAQALLFTGRYYLQQHDLVIALDCLERALNLRPRDIETIIACASANRDAGNLDRARSLLNAAAAVDPDHRGVHEILRSIDVHPADAQPASTQLAGTAALVSILIRSMDRPTLARALDSAATQTWPNLEIVVVAACGSRHRTLPPTWNGRTLRLIYPQADRRLPRPDAANACLDAARGEWLNFLDDDDELLPQHVATLLAAARPGSARVLYSRAQVRDGDGKPTGHIGFASFPVQLYYQNRSHPAATLFQRSLVEQGARFDPEFAVYEDHDFFINCATRSAFQFVDAETCVWNAYSGESGCGHGNNQDDAQREIYTEKLRRKWADFFAPLLRQPEALLFVGQQYLRDNDLPIALDCLERALAAKPGDINALNLCGMANLRAGNLDRAERLLNEALRQLPDHAGLQRNLALLQRARAG